MIYVYIYMYIYYIYINIYKYINTYIYIMYLYISCIYIYIYIYLHMVFTTEAFLEVAIESWLEWDLNPRPLNSVQKLQPTELSGHEFKSLSEPTLYRFSNFISLFSVHVSFRSLPSSVATFALSEVSHR